MKRCSLYADTAGHCCPGKTACVYIEQSKEPNKVKEIAIAAASQMALLIFAAACTFIFFATLEFQCIDADKINQEVDAYVRTHAKL